MISSSDNKQVKNVIQLISSSKARKKQGLFVVEGIRMVQETPLDRIEAVYISSAFEEDYLKHPMSQNCAYEVVEDKIFQKMSDTQTPQGILAVVQKRTYTIQDILNSRTAGCILILDGIQDPGNLGTMIRTGEGAGISGVILSKDTADLYNPKTIRSTMGSIYRVPHVISESLMETVEELKQQGVNVVATHLRGKKEYQELEYSGLTGILIGNEGNGLSEELADSADELVRIPMEGSVESLNAAIAAALFMYEIKRKRK